MAEISTTTPPDDRSRVLSRDRNQAIGTAAQPGLGKLIAGAFSGWGDGGFSGPDMNAGSPRSKWAHLLMDSKIPQNMWRKFEQDAEQFGLQTEEQIIKFIRDIERNSGL
jgi:hypothetical protein